MIRFRIGSLISSFVLATGLLAGAAGVSHAQNLVTLFDIRESVISPDADGHVDSTRVRYTINASATTVSLIVYESDGVTPVYTLTPPNATTSGQHVVYWKGQRTGGGTAAEGAYIVKLYARAASNPDSVKTLPVFVDVTRPSVQILSALPNPYAPGAPGSTESVRFSFAITNTSPLFPGRVADELRVAFANPSGAALVVDSLLTTPAYAGLDGNYILAWYAGEQAVVPPDGEFRVTLTLTDVAGYQSVSSYLFDVDTVSPVVKVTSLAENASVDVVPDSLRGFAFDKRGVDSLLVRYATTDPYEPVGRSWASGDTLRFATTLASEFSSEGLHTVGFRAVDMFGRATSYEFSFRIDTTSPPAPVLDPFAGTGNTWNSASYPLTGHANDGNDNGSYVRVYRNGALVDSVSTFVSNNFKVKVALVPGRNDLFAILRDSAMNVSPRSSTLTVNFDTGAGVFAPAPFGPGDHFDVNTDRRASGCSLRIFDLLGQVVHVFEDGSSANSYSFPWNGQNGSSADVRKGPLVVVATLEYGDGSREVFREVFLFDPDAP